MKEGIHPNYQQTTIKCACGNVIETGSTKKDIRVEVCSKVSPLLHRQAEAGGYRRTCGEVQQALRSGQVKTFLQDPQLFGCGSFTFAAGYTILLGETGSEDAHGTQNFGRKQGK